jgi:hypothetical protein
MEQKENDQQVTDSLSSTATSSISEKIEVFVFNKNLTFF